MRRAHQPRASSIMDLHEITVALPVIASLVLIEGLLSVDNVLGIAALAKELPPEQQKKTIRIGMVGAYLFRVLALFAVSWLVGNLWVRWVAAGYLVYLMCSHLTKHDNKGDEHGDAPKLKSGFAAVLTQIALMDLSLSIDNVIAAVALAPRDENGMKVMWPIFVGVLFAILALLTITPYAVKLLEKHPILEPTAFILIGFVGMLLMGEEAFHWHVPSALKFGCIVSIVVTALVYARSSVLRAIADPVFVVIRPVMRLLAFLGDMVLGVFTLIPRLLQRGMGPAR
jgi:tellurite resistance protein TerC